MGEAAQRLGSHPGICAVTPASSRRSSVVSERRTCSSAVPTRSGPSQASARTTSPDLRPLSTSCQGGERRNRTFWRPRVSVRLGPEVRYSASDRHLRRQAEHIGRCGAAAGDRSPRCAARASTVLWATVPGCRSGSRSAAHRRRGPPAAVHRDEQGATGLSDCGAATKVEQPFGRQRDALGQTSRTSQD